MAVITVSRNYGCRGQFIAEQVAQRLGYHFVDKTFIGKVLSDYCLIEFDREIDHIPGFWEKFTFQGMRKSREMVSLLDRVIRAVARHGDVVILGRSGFVVLEDLADVLNVRIQAPFDFRVRQLMEHNEVSEEEAEALIQQGDRVRSEFVRIFYGVGWESSSAFDLVIDTSRIAATMATDWLVDAARAIESQELTGQPNAAAMTVDMWLAESVAIELESRSAVRA